VRGAAAARCWAKNSSPARAGCPAARPDCGFPGGTSWCSLWLFIMTTLQTTIRNRIDDLESVRNLVSTLERNCDLPAKVVFDINVVLDELLSNIIHYGYADKAEHQIHIKLSKRDAAVEIAIEDDGKAFNPLAAPAPDLTLPLAERPVGGLGVHFVKQLMDDVKYQRDNNNNYMFLKKNIS
jgi:anti-sigma regulatory factor (Ser/Thr protein kinase)